MIFELKKLSILSGLFLIACSSESPIEPVDTCRNYATSYTSDTGITTTCTFDRNTFLLSCSDDSSNTMTKQYSGTEEFVFEVSALGRETYLSRLEEFNGLSLLTTNSFENGQHRSKHMDVSSLYGFGRFVLYQHDTYDSIQRPTSSYVTTNISHYCAEQILTMEYSEQDKILRTRFESEESSCQVFNDLDITFDVHGNIVRESNLNITIDYVVNETESICI